MNTATNGRAPRAPIRQRSAGELLLRQIRLHLHHLDPRQWERLKELAALLERAADASERDEIIKAVCEIVVPESIGGVGKFDAVEEETRQRVAAYRKKVGELVRRRRQELGLSQQQLADLAGIPQSHVSRIERGHHAPTHVTVKRIAEALKTKPSLLDPGFEDTEEV